MIMAVVQDLSKNQLVVADIVSGAWQEYIRSTPCFLDHVTFKVKVLPIGQASFTHIMPYHGQTVIRGDDANFETLGYGISKYLAPAQLVTWGKQNIRQVRESVDLYDSSLFFAKGEYITNYITSSIATILATFEQDFATMLQSNVWNTIVQTMPPVTPPIDYVRTKIANTSITNSDTISVHTPLTFASYAQCWYLTCFDNALRPPLAFIPDISELNPQVLQLCSSYAQSSGNKSAELACDPNLLEAITGSYPANSTMMHPEKLGEMRYGALSVYTLPSLKQTLRVKWTQGATFLITGVAQNPTDSTLTNVTLSWDVIGTYTPDTGIYISKDIPFVVGIKRFSPFIPRASETDHSDASYDDWSLGNLFTFNSVEDFNQSASSTFVVKVKTSQLRYIEAAGFPTINAKDTTIGVDLVYAVCSLPWQPKDFFRWVKNVRLFQDITGGIASDPKLPLATNVRLHKSYLYPKQAAWAYAIKKSEKMLDERTRNETTDEVPFTVTTKYQNSSSDIVVTTQCIMPMSITPQLGGVYLFTSCCGSESSLSTTCISTSNAKTVINSNSESSHANKAKDKLKKEEIVDNIDEAPLYKGEYITNTTPPHYSGRGKMSEPVGGDEVAGYKGDRATFRDVLPKDQKDLMEQWIKTKGSVWVPRPKWNSEWGPRKKK